ncbi:Gfo/Idh/MocA family protein [Streptomyces sp. ok210]|uniref:Gfo/Idh/MocA family protein n=1 Tax=Streptomyces sp. ok210 TaxID=1761905 RepID=UPI0008E36675|nr:Gfo/Idh/MocA family oxidoreductase [Streptomyces sp. ok210]SFT31389.1 Predicted dehydrogenase [Streptomyces sp. ok210]
MKPLVHAVIGCGRVAPNHVDGFSALPNAELRWACDRDLSRAESLAREYGLPRATSDVRDVLADPELDSVSIAVDHAQHYELAAAALKAGKHVLVEKPLALTVEEGTALTALAERTGRVLSVVSQHRYDPVVTSVRSWIANGHLGHLVSGTVSLQCGRDDDYYADSYWRGTFAGEGGSALVNQGYHALDVTRWLIGDLAVVGAAVGHTAPRGGMETEDTLAAVLRGPQGALMTYQVTVASSITWRTRIELVGTEGSVLFDLDHPGTLHLAEGSEALRAAAREVETQVEPAPAGIGYYGISHRQQIADFATAVRDGRPMTADGTEGLRTLRLLQEMYTWARSGGASASLLPTAVPVPAPSAAVAGAAAAPAPSE